MRVITFLNEKGGVGKTLTAINTAAWLAIKGYRVVVFDADAQANATTGLDIIEKPGVTNILLREADWDDELRRVRPEVISKQPVPGELWVLPSNIESRDIGASLPDHGIVHERFQGLALWADYIIVDTAPTAGLFHVSLLLASDAVVFPTICDKDSIIGVRKAISRLKGNAALRTSLDEPMPPTIAKAIVPTRYEETRLHYGQHQALKKEFGEQTCILDPIVKSIVWGEAKQESKSLFAHAPDSKAAAQMAEVAAYVTS